MRVCVYQFSTVGWQLDEMQYVYSAEYNLTLLLLTINVQVNSLPKYMSYTRFVNRQRRVIKCLCGVYTFLKVIDVIWCILLVFSIFAHVCNKSSNTYNVTKQAKKVNFVSNIV